MGKNYISEDYIETDIAHGAHTYIEKKNIIAFCTYPLHRGALTKSVIKSHDCVNKKCKYFKKTNAAYWEALEHERKVKSEKYLRGKAKKDPLLETIASVQKIAIELGYKIRVETVVFFPYTRLCTVHYSPIRGIEYKYDFNPLLREMGMALGKYVTLKKELSIWEEAQLIANKHELPICFTGEKKINKHYYELYYTSLFRRFDCFEELKPILEKELHKSINIQVDVSTLLDHARILCKQNRLKVKIISQSYDAEKNMYTINYSANKPLLIEPSISRILGKHYHCVIKFQQIKEKIESNFTILDKAQTVVSMNGCQIVFTRFEKLNDECYILFYNGAISKKYNHHWLSTMIGKKTRTGIKILADTKYLPDHLQTLCKQINPEFHITKYSYDEEGNVYSFSYLPNHFIVDRNWIESELGNAYDVSIRLLPVKEQHYDESFAYEDQQNEMDKLRILELGQRVANENGYNIDFTFAEKINRNCYFLKFNALIFESDNLLELATLISKHTHTCISIQADMAFLLEHVNFLCYKTNPDIQITQHKSDSEYNIYTFLYYSKDPLENRNVIISFLEKLYHCQIRLIKVHDKEKMNLNRFI